MRVRHYLLAMIRNSAGLPLVRCARRYPLLINEGGRGFTLSVYARPWGVRVYIAGHAWEWWA